MTALSYNEGHSSFPLLQGQRRRILEKPTKNTASLVGPHLQRTWNFAKMLNYFKIELLEKEPVFLLYKFLAFECIRESLPFRNAAHSRNKRDASNKTKQL